jgi:hypothetical protein
MSTAPLSEDHTTTFTHLVAVYDAGRQQLRFYVNGELQGSATQSTPWQANGPLTVGAARWASASDNSRIVDGWYGGIDDVLVFQGAMTDAQVNTLHEQQDLPTL